MDNSLIKLSKEVKFGLKNNKPLVALESTLISHGLPYPENIKVAELSINAVKNNGSIPATIATINGKIKVGLNEKDIQILAKNKNVHKVTKNNLTIIVNNKFNGATTVGSTINIASKIGIKFFSTGGIGGAHGRGGGVGVDHQGGHQDVQGLGQEFRVETVVSDDYIVLQLLQ